MQVVHNDVQLLLRFPPDQAVCLSLALVFRQEQMILHSLCFLDYQAVLILESKTIADERIQ